MTNKISFTLLVFFSPLFLAQKSTLPTIEELVIEKGYPFETHVIETKDGYLLTYHRIPHGKTRNNYQNDDGKMGPPVLLQHGLMCSSAVWLLNNDSLGYAIADAGFDLWLGNSRGNTFSRQHKELDPDRSAKFWKFSFHEMGVHDLPAAIDYILKATSRKKLFYVGHSMGTTMFYVMGATCPEYMAKVRAMVALAPVSHPRHVTSPLLNFCLYLKHALVGMFKVLRRYEIFPRSNPWINDNICSKKQYGFICRMGFKLIDGFQTKKRINRIALSMILSYLPAGSSLMTLRHFTQLTSKRAPFKMYDYGPKRNLRMYGSYLAPIYDLDKVTAPMYIYYGMNDWLATPKDVLFSKNFFPNVRKLTRVPHEDFSHLDFMWTTDKHLVFDDVISTLKKVENEDENV